MVANQVNSTDNAAPAQTEETKPKAKTSTRQRNSTKNQLQPLLKALKSAKNGDFSVRLSENNGLGEVALAFNELMSANENFTTEIQQTSQRIGEEGKLNDRMALGNAKGSWATSIKAINSLVDCLVKPSTEAERVLGAIAQGDLSQKMALEVDGKPLALPMKSALKANWARKR
jgi:methyl-accepting chemotaxis protein